MKSRSKAILNPVSLAAPQSGTSEDTGHSANRQASDSIIQVMQKQHDLTELLVKQQRQVHLPSKDIQVFTGDPLTYKSFIRSFIQRKTDNEKDKLCYLEQYTAGEPQELVRSCEYMPLWRGGRGSVGVCSGRKTQETAVSKWVKCKMRNTCL